MTRLDERLVALSEETTSPAYISDTDTFAGYVRDEDVRLHVHRDCGVVEVTEPGTLSRPDPAVNGFAVTGQFDREGFDAQLSVPVETVLSRTPLRPADFPVSFFKVIAVDPARQGEGIGTELGATAVAPLFAEPPALVVAWVRDDPSNRRLVEQYSERPVARFTDYFGPEWACPECGFDSTCHCDAELYAYFGDERDRPDDASGHDTADS